MWTQSTGSTDKSREEQGRPRQRPHDRRSTKNRKLCKKKNNSQSVGQFILYRTYLFMLLCEQNQSL